MKTLRIVALTSVFAAFGLMTGCDLFGTDSSNESPTITDTRLDNGTLNASTGGSTTVRGIVADDAAGMSLSLKVMQGTTDKSSSFTISFTDIPSAEKSWSIGSPDQGKGSIAAKSTAASGTYDLVYTVTDAAGASATAKVSFAVVGGTTTTSTPIVSKGTLDVGGTSATPPSFIGLNPVARYTSSQTITNFAKVDLVVTNAANTTTAIFESTAAGVIDATLQQSYWAGGRATLIKDVGTTVPADLEAAIAALGTSTSQSANIVAGHTYVAKTAEGLYAVLTASNVVGTGANVTLTVTVYE
jgi:hypothetical protein